jgi:hypothetical protein
MPPADPSTYCPVCGYAWQVRGCTKGKCHMPVSRDVLATMLRRMADEAGVTFVDGLEQGELAVDDFRFVRQRPGFTPDFAIISGDLPSPYAMRGFVAMVERQIKGLLRGPRPTPSAKTPR